MINRKNKLNINYEPGEKLSLMQVSEDKSDEFNRVFKIKMNEQGNIKSFVVDESYNGYYDNKVEWQSTTRYTIGGNKENGYTIDVQRLGDDYEDKLSVEYSRSKMDDCLLCEMGDLKERESWYRYDKMSYNTEVYQMLNATFIINGQEYNQDSPEVAALYEKLLDRISPERKEKFEEYHSAYYSEYIESAARENDPLLQNIKQESYGINIDAVTNPLEGLQLKSLDEVIKK